MRDTLDFRFSDSQERIELLIEKIRERPDIDIDQIEKLTDMMDQSLFREMILEIADILREQGIVENSYTENDVEEIIVDEMRVFRWEKVNDYTYLERRVLYKLIKAEIKTEKTEVENWERDDQRWENDMIFSNSTCSWLKYYIARAEGLLDDLNHRDFEEGENKVIVEVFEGEKGECSFEAYREKEFMDLRYAENPEITSEFDEVHNIKVEVRKFLNSILEYKGHEKRFYKMRPGELHFTLFDTSENKEIIDKYLG